MKSLIRILFITLLTFNTAFAAGLWESESGGGGGTTDNTTDTRIPYKNGTVFDNSPLYYDSSVPKVVSDVLLEVPGGTLAIGETTNVSACTGAVIVSNELNGDMNYVAVSEFDDTGSGEPAYLNLGAEYLLSKQADFSETITTNPLTFNFTGTVTSPDQRQINELHMKTGAILTNFRGKFTDNASGVVVAYLPSKAEWDAGTGLTTVSGDNSFCFLSSAADTPGVYNFGIRPFMALNGQQIDVDLRADAIDILGLSGTPYVKMDVQDGPYREIAAYDDSLSPTTRALAVKSQSATGIAEITIDDSTGDEAIGLLFNDDTNVANLIFSNVVSGGVSIVSHTDIGMTSSTGDAQLGAIAGAVELNAGPSEPITVNLNNESLVISAINNDDSVPIMSLKTYGTYGDTIEFNVGDRDPEGAVTADPGRVYYTVDGIDSRTHQYQGAASGNTGWATGVTEKYGIVKVPELHSEGNANYLSTSLLGHGSDPNAFASLDWVQRQDKSTIPNGSLTFLDSHYVSASGAYDVCGDGKFLFVANSTPGVSTFRQDSEGDLDYIGTTNLTAAVLKVATDGKFVYAASGTAGIWVLSISNTGVLSIVDTDDQTGTAKAVHHNGKFLLVGYDIGGLVSYSVSDTGKLSHLNTNTADTNNVVDVWSDENFIYIADEGGGLRSFTIDDDGILTHVSTNDVGGYALDVWGDDRGFIFLANYSSGISSFNVSDAGVLTHIDTDDQGGQARGVYGRNNYVYLANAAMGILSYYVDDAGMFHYLSPDDQGDTAYEVWAFGKYVYLANYTGGLVVYTMNYAYEYDQENAQHDFVGDIDVDSGHFTYIKDGILESEIALKSPHTGAVSTLVIKDSGSVEKVILTHNDDTNFNGLYFETAGEVQTTTGNLTINSDAGLLYLEADNDISIAPGIGANLLADLADEGTFEVDGLGHEDDDPLLVLKTSSTNPGTANIYVGDRDPTGNVSAPPGSKYYREDGIDSATYIHQGATTNNTGWVENITVDERTLVYNLNVDGVDENEFTWIGEYRVESAGETGDYADDFACNTQHAAIEVNSLTGSGVVTFTGVLVSESTGVPTAASTETITVDATGKYQTNGKWIEITNIDIPVGITAINYDVEVLGYLDLQNADFEVLAYRVDAKASGNDADASIHIMKVQDDGSKKCSIVDIEHFGKDAKNDLVVDELRTGGNDRSYTAASSIWEDETNTNMKADDYETYFTSDENIIEGSSKAEGIIIHLEGTSTNNLKQVTLLTLHLTVRMN
ncbi:MAG: hypothetical protein GY941_23680 [Planctomycetes bacterium]|nr:hypothetical protein [Planctomycetota bacterium]